MQRWQQKPGVGTSSPDSPEPKAHAADSTHILQPIYTPGMRRKAGTHRRERQGQDALCYANATSMRGLFLIYGSSHVDRS